MSSAIYDALARSKLLREVEHAFHDTTGLSLKLVRRGEPQRSARGRDKNAFCALMGTSAGACAACVEVQRRLHSRLDHKLTPKMMYCDAGMIELVVPVVVGGQHVATLLGGQVFRQKPGRRQFDGLARQMRKWGVHASLSLIRRAYFHTPVVSDKQLEGAVRLLTILARQLAESSSRFVLATGRHEPASVTQAKAFVHAHAGERVTLGQTAAHVHVSRHHFCKIFKRATGITFTEFVARVRLENAKGLLSNPRLRISDVAGSAGFSSISQFNRVFRRTAGNSPTAYRAGLLRAASAS